MKSIIIYFSRADENYAVGYITKGNTEVVAEYIKELTNADIFKVEPLNPYSKEYNVCIKEAKERTKTHNAPLKGQLPNLSDYELIYVGTPVYWEGMPEEMFTALKNLDYKNKIIKPFVTHEGSGLSSIPNQLKELCPNATIKEGLAIQGSKVYESKNIVEKWLNS